MIEILRLILVLVLGVFVTSPALAAEENALVDKDALDQEKIIYMDQNWSNRDRQFFYFTDQGSRFIPYDIFINLEQAGRQELFRAPENMLRYGYIPVPASKENPDALPIGFVHADQYLGLTCAACHTQQLKYAGKFVRIDGGQSMADLPKLVMELETALGHTLNQAEVYGRFQERILGDRPSAKKVQMLKKRLEQTWAMLKDYNRRNHTEVAYGYTRLDAFGAILNKGLHLTGVKDNFNPPNAPTSYPYMWDTPQHDYVEWDGSQSNSNIGALARNVGEVIGVFGQVNTTPEKWLFYFDGGYASSIQTRNLRKLELTVAKLYSPLWPEIFPKINQDKAHAGRGLYARYCVMCHQDIDRDDPARRIQVRMSSLDRIKTDPLMAKNAIERKGKTGIFAGKPRFYNAGDIMGEEVPALYVANNIMVGVLRNNLLQSYLALRDAKKLGHGEEIHPPKYLDGEILKRGTEVSEAALLAYKARPLNGIWTGAPYLHNGSVPNLYQLLLPAARREKNFYIGSWEFDPVNVGYATGATPGAFLFDTTLAGNSNSGHEYGTGYDGLPALTDEEILNLVEYMKTL